MNGGKILTLQKIQGHTTPAMALRYTHLAPDHLPDAIRLGPASDHRRFLGIITP
ncbi:integrase [Ectopseudomonas khazarica]|uniref:integrase n=1 Tax=Ectopseudomonas khazarica TaxID=2502979 RepID=UPI00240CFA41|nr:integrase [Pseudomonas sp. REST10]